METLCFLPSEQHCVIFLSIELSLTCQNVTNQTLCSVNCCKLVVLEHEILISTENAQQKRKVHMVCSQRAKTCKNTGAAL